MCRTLPCHQQYFSHKSNTWGQTGCCEGNWLCPSQPVDPKAWWRGIRVKIQIWTTYQIWQMRYKSPPWSSICCQCPLRTGAMLWALISLSGFDLSEWFPSQTPAVRGHTFYCWIRGTFMTGTYYLPDNVFAYWKTLGLIFMWTQSLLIQLKQILLRWPVKYVFTTCVTFP